MFIIAKFLKQWGCRARVRAAWSDARCFWRQAESQSKHRIARTGFMPARSGFRLVRQPILGLLGGARQTGWSGCSGKNRGKDWKVSGKWKPLLLLNKTSRQETSWTENVWQFCVTMNKSKKLKIFSSAPSCKDLLTKKQCKNSVLVKLWSLSE